MEIVMVINIINLLMEIWKEYFIIIISFNLDFMLDFEVFLVLAIKVEVLKFYKKIKKFEKL
jgi:hypothetical protein